MSDDNLQTILNVLLVFTLFASLFTGSLLLTYVSIHDYIGVEMIDIGEEFVAKGLALEPYVTSMEQVLVSSENFPQYVDYFFLGFLVAFIVNVLNASYQIRRRGYLSTYGYTLFGSLITLFLLSYYLQTSLFIKDILFNLIPNVTPSIPIFTWYLTNSGIITMVLMFACIIMNFLDFNFIKFKSRKKTEFVNDEI